MRAREAHLGLGWITANSGDREYPDSRSSLVVEALMRSADDTEILDDQIRTCWRGRNSVSGDRHASIRSRTRDDNKTVVGAGGSPPAAYRRHSCIPSSISADPRSGRRVCRPQDQQRLPGLLITVN